MWQIYGQPKWSSGKHGVWLRGGFFVSRGWDTEMGQEQKAFGGYLWYLLGAWKRGQEAFPDIVLQCFRNYEIVGIGLWTECLVFGQSCPAFQQGVSAHS